LNSAWLAAHGKGVESAQFNFDHVNLGSSHAFDLAGTGPLTVRFDVINVADKVYQIRSGSGVGVFAPQSAAGVLRRSFLEVLMWRL